MFAATIIATVGWLTAASPERVLLLQDPQSASLEQVAVHHTLLQNLLADPGVDVFVDRPFSPTLRRAVALRQQANLSLAAAKQALHTLRPAAAADAAAAAAQKLARVAALTGDVAPLQDALALQTTAYLWMRAYAPAEATLQRLLGLDPDYRPDPALYNPDMQRFLAQVRLRANRRPRRRLMVCAEPERAAIFLDGRFIGFGTGELDVMANAPHYVVTMAEGYSSRAQAVPAQLGNAPDANVRMVLLAESVPQSDAYANLVAASQRHTAFPDPSAPLLRAWSIDTVLVLAYETGALRLVAFDLRQGQRRATSTATAVTDLRDAALAAAELIANAPPLALVPATTQH